MHSLTLPSALFGDYSSATNQDLSVIRHLEDQTEI